jgi:hypothetical protein
MRARFSLVVALMVAVVSTAGLAQSERTAAAVVLADGMVSLDDRPVDAASLPSVLPENALLRTERGRTAIALKRGGWLFLDAGASVRVLGNRTYNFNRIEVLAGSAILASGTSAPLADCENQVRLSTAGMFRFDVRRVGAGGERSCQVRVYEGAAAVQLVSVTNALRAGETMACSRRCGDMIPTTEFPPDQLDEFDRWAGSSYERLKK